MLSSTALTLSALLTCCWLIQCSVFVDRPAAGQLLRSSTRRPRANSFNLEELLPGDLERECYEERCSKEEATEIFQTHETTMEFWFRYTNLNPCRTNPCLNGGICTLDREGFLCLCPPNYKGKMCNTVVSECRYKNGGCLQYCRDQAGGAEVQCGCADGYELEADRKSCTPSVAFPCGRQQIVALFDVRSLLDSSEDANVTMETDSMLDYNITDRVLEHNTTYRGVLEHNTTDSGALEHNPTDRGALEHNATYRGVLEHNATDRGALEHNPTESSEESRTVNATTCWIGGNETEQRERKGAELSPRVVGGNLESRGGSPWQVLIHRADGFGFCGGTLVSDRWVVSAAHCFEESADYVTIGDYDKKRPDPGEQTIKIQEVFVHPHFHSYTYDSDIALIYLAQSVLRGPTVAPACLPDAHLSGYLLRDEIRGVVTGWGATRYLGSSSRFLRKVTLPVVSHEACTASTEQVITDNMFCAGYLDTNMDACSGDSGGPFVVHYRGTWFLTGIISWGEQCAAKGKYGVYTRLGNFLNWIRDTMQRLDRKGTLSL